MSKLLIQASTILFCASLPALAWEKTVETSPLTDDLTILLSTASEAPLSCNAGMLAQLVVRCSGGSTDIYVSHGCYAPGLSSGLVNVRVRVDDEKPIWERTFAGTAEESFGWWDNREAREKIRELLFDHERLVVQLEPYRASPEILVFNTSSLREQFQSVDQCRWNFLSKLP